MKTVEFVIVAGVDGHHQFLRRKAMGKADHKLGSPDATRQSKNSQTPTSVHAVNGRATEDRKEEKGPFNGLNRLLH
jgi:hypothetical protein